MQHLTRCPHCGREDGYNAAFAGREVRCAGCNRAFVADDRSGPGRSLSVRGLAAVRTWTARDWRNVSAAAAVVAAVCFPLSLAIGDSIGDGLPLSIPGLLAAAVSVAAGCRAIKEYRYALWWVIPMGLVVVQCVGFVLAGVLFALWGPRIGWPDNWGR